MPQLTIKRTKEWNNSFRDIDIYINGESIGSVWNGKTKSFNLKPGIIELTAKVDWCSSQVISIDLKNNEEVNFELSSYKFGKYITLIMLILILVFNLLNSQGVNYTEYLLLVILPLSLYMVHFLTFGRKHYLRLRKL